MAKSVQAAVEELRNRIPNLPMTKLQKLLYYAQGHHLAAFGEPLFSDTISAWDHGPVVSTVWHERDIPEPSYRLADKLDEGELNTVGFVVARYGGLSAGELERLTHGERPWIEADSQRRPGKSVRIEVDSIRTYFEELSREDDVEPLDSDQLEQLLRGAADRAKDGATKDDPNELRARLAALAE